MSTPLASFFTKLGFEIDKTSLNAVNKQLDMFNRKVQSMAESFNKISNTPALRAAARLANAEVRRISAEAALVKDKVRLAGIEGRVAIAQAKVQDSANKLASKKETTSGYYAKANASEILMRAKAGFSADMAAVKESLDSGKKLRAMQERDQKQAHSLIIMKKRNEIDESKLRRTLIKNQSDAAKHSLKAANNLSVVNSRIQQVLARTAEVQARTQMKSTPYARAPKGAGGGEGGSPLLTTENLQTFAGLEGLRRFAMQSYNVGNFQVSQPIRYEFILGNKEEAAKQVEFLNKEVDRLGLSLMDANHQYTQLLATSADQIGIENTQKLFSGAQNLATMLGLSTDAQNRMFRAFGQMASKSQIMAEELNFRLAA